MAKRFSDKIVVLTGASSGIGRDAALMFAKEGAKLVIAARRRERLEELAKEIETLGQEALVLALDFCEEQSASELIEKTIEHYGRIDILVNNAGFGQQKSLEATSANDVQRIFQVNILTVVHTIRLAIPHLQKTQGVIVNVASVAGLVPMPLHSLYNATKFAMVGLARSLQFEFKRSNIRIITICPGPVQTEFMDNLEGHKFPAWIQKRWHLIMDNSQTIARNILKAAQRKKSAVVYASLRSRLACWSYNMTRPIARWVYTFYVNKMLDK